MVVLGTIALASIIGSSLELRWSPAEDLAYLAVLGSVVAILMIARGLTGSWSKRQLRVDVAAGKLKLPDGSLRDLDALGELTIEKKPMRNMPSRRVIRVVLHDYLLRAANVGYYLFESNYEAETKIRYDAVDAAVLQHRLRRILERPTGEGSAFRSAPDARAEVLEVAGTPDRACAALQVLMRDHDRSVRDHATKLLGSIS
ncbi:MAG: hypothetical protein HOV81_01745 [Kofleriaceae bacterium]|nr:hypothetical protein [Kofleriaceae bacterium]